MEVFEVEREFWSGSECIRETVELEADTMGIPLDDPSGYVMFRDADGRIVDAFDNESVTRVTRVEH